MNKTIKKILEAHIGALKDAYKNGHRIACYSFHNAGMNKMAALAMSLIPEQFRKDMDLQEAMLFNTKVIHIAWELTGL